jgi:hypothetical protein
MIEFIIERRRVKEYFVCCDLKIGGDDLKK